MRAGALVLPLELTMTVQVGEVVRAARQGDRRAFGELHRRYARMVHAVLLVRVPAQVAADLVQDVFLAALERLDSLRDADAFGGWLAQIARNRAMDHLRGRRPTEEVDPELPSRAASAEAAVEAARVLAIVRQLPEAYQETLLMRLVEGMSGDEIAEQTGLTPASVRVNLHRGMKLLRERLGIVTREQADE
jgi:RNA polymerase sigma-70 factor (ECF subfamily)